MIDVIGKWIILAMQGNCLVEITHLPEKDVLLQSVLIRHKKHRYMTRPIRAVFFDSNSKLMYVILLFVWICFYFVVSNTPLYEDDFYFVFFSTPDDVNWYPYTQWFPSAYTERFSGVPPVVCGSRILSGLSVDERCVQLSVCRGLDSVVLSFCYFCHTWEDKCFPMSIMSLVRLCGRMDQRGLCRRVGCRSDSLFRFRF